MFVVLFEVQPHAELWDEYLGVAALLRPELETVDGFVDNTRFASARTPGRLLSLSTWRDEKALVRWRAHAVHHEHGQRRGRSEIFTDYRIRVAEVTHDTHAPDGIPVVRSRSDVTETGSAAAVTILEPLDAARPDALLDLRATAGLVDVERYDGVLDPHAPLLLASWTGPDAAEASTPPLTDVRIRHATVIREYGMRDRREAPQYFPDVR
ncbi:antibiotic biosynthesis monooxygenase family protein [Microbispora catharanthi]|uniref:Antibiotic biosynthesis monooxygenase n=1 Tax=Microbispora catharanthi TaxID=1712871 RepID=A0A5N6BE41_9ACTN|nr:antibiotic biosynthesis monooxygenase [Microbispora catharanthi]KAB8178816.1 antibiotic biosynthesis monooxygenase [Microbispora catharanthi]